MERREDEAWQFKVLVASKDYAILTGHAKLKMIYKDENIEQFPYTLTAVWQRLDKEWKIIHMHESGNLEGNSDQK